QGRTHMDFGNVTGFVREHSVLVISAVLALLSFAFTEDPIGSFGSIDVRTLCILFCFMATVAVMTGCGAFDRLGSALVSKSNGTRTLCLTLVLIPYVCSMFITNDVALITFVPLAIGVLEGVGRKDLMAPVIVLQTAAANLGSVITPFGNPQNLYLFSRYGLSFGDFIQVLLPMVVVGTVILIVMTVIISKGKEETVISEKGELSHRPILMMACILFVLCIATVMRMIPFRIALVIVLVCILATIPRALMKVDYGLLLTFVFLFMFTGNIASNPEIADLLGGLMEWDPITTSALASQFISNVPAAVLLSGFTEDWAGLLAGVDIGGFGTPIASMASLISLRLYMGTDGADMRRFMGFFAGTNIIVLATLLIVYRII
ncbi:MAG: SLC13 family permease, partial [Candidatus Methanomethylophilaceae archaeon]